MCEVHQPKRREFVEAKREVGDVSTVPVKGEIPVRFPRNSRRDCSARYYLAQNQDIQAKSTILQVVLDFLLA